MLMVTAGVVFVCFASRTRPFGSVTRVGLRPEDATSGGRAVNRQRIEPADGAGGFREDRGRGLGDFLERDGGDPRAEVREDVHAGDRLEVAELVRDVRDAVVLEDEAGVQLALRLRA